MYAALYASMTYYRAVAAHNKEQWLRQTSTAKNVFYSFALFACHILVLRATSQHVDVKKLYITVHLSTWPGLNLGLAPAALADLASTSTTYAKSLYLALASNDFLTTETAANGKGRPCIH